MDSEINKTPMLCGGTGILHAEHEEGSCEEVLNSDYNERIIIGNLELDGKTETLHQSITLGENHG